MSVAARDSVHDVATRLRTAREEAGLSIEDLSARTKIKPAMLLALEQGAFEQLPGEFFARAFLRTYARELHLPVADVMADYEQAVAPVDAALPTATTASMDPPRAIDLEDGPSWRKAWTVVAFGAVFLLSLFLLNRATDETAAEPGAVGTSGAAPVASAPEPSAQRQLPSAPESITIEIRPLRPVWVTGTADGERVLFRLLDAGERITLEANDRLSFRVGDAGAFAFSLNGSPARTIGRDGEVREFSVTRKDVAALTR